MKIRSRIANRSQIGKSGQAVLEAAVVTSCLILFFTLMTLLANWCYVYWGSQAALYESLVCHASIHIQTSETCESKAKRKIEAICFHLCRSQISVISSSKRIMGTAQVTSKLLIWNIQDSIKIPLTKSEEL